jgi:hypothetical protein
MVGWLSGGDTHAEDALESHLPRVGSYQGSKVTTTGILNGDALLEKKGRRPVNQPAAHVTNPRIEHYANPYWVCVGSSSVCCL